MKLHDKMELIQELKTRVSEDSGYIIDIYNAIYIRLQDLEENTQEEALEKGVCFHIDLIDVTTMTDAADGKRRLMCKDCREFFYKEME